MILRIADVDFLTIGQYLQPTREACSPWTEFVTPEEFAEYAVDRPGEGFPCWSLSTPLTRSSYHADSDFARHCGRPVATA